MSECACWCVCRKYCKGIRKQVGSQCTWRRHFREANDDEKSAIRLARHTDNFCAFIENTASAGPSVAENASALTPDSNQPKRARLLGRVSLGKFPTNLLNARSCPQTALLHLLTRLTCTTTHHTPQIALLRLSTRLTCMTTHHTPQIALLHLSTRLTCTMTHHTPQIALLHLLTRLTCMTTHHTPQITLLRLLTRLTCTTSGQTPLYIPLLTWI